MARISPISKAQFIALSFLSLLATTIVAKPQDEKSSFVKKLSKNKHFGHKEEKLSHFRFYWHDIFSGKNPSAVTIVRPPNNNTSTLFGTLSMIDDPITEGPEISSKLLGKAQGFYGYASQQEAALLMAMNFYFVQGKYNGSTITILGRNPIFNKVREMPVIGGSGLFRFARGYAQASTHKSDAATGDATVEYNVYVMHY